MGFAASRFATLTELTYNTQRLGKFILSAIVLNDVNDNEFISHMADKMEYLNGATKDKFSFFSLIDPPEVWNGLPNPIFRDQLCMRIRPTSEKGDRAMLYSFLSQIDYDNAPLPGILLTKGDLQEKSYIYLPTSIEQIDDQLIALGDFCAHKNEYVRLDNPELIKLLDQISGIDKKWLTIKNEQSVAESLRLVSAPDDIHKGFLNRKYSLDTISDYFRKERKTNKIASFLAFCLSKLCHSPHDYSNHLQIDTRRIQGLDDETERYLNTYNVLLNLLKPNRIYDREIQYIMDREDRERLSLSSINNTLLTAVENELNLSIVQLMRMELGIPMPEYYCKYMDNNNAFVLCGNNNHIVRLNARSYLQQRGNLRVISIGDIRGAYRAMDLNCFDQNEGFEQLLYEFSQLREAHPGRAEGGERAIVTCNDLFNDNFIGDYWRDILRIKQDLQRSNIISSNQ